MTRSQERVVASRSTASRQQETRRRCFRTARVRASVGKAMPLSCGDHPSSCSPDHRPSGAVRRHWCSCSPKPRGSAGPTGRPLCRIQRRGDGGRGHINLEGGHRGCPLGPCPGRQRCRRLPHRGLDPDRGGARRSWRTRERPSRSIQRIMASIRLFSPTSSQFSCR